MPAVMRAAAAAERAGVPAVAIGGSGFEPMGRVIGRSLGIGHVPIVSYPGVILTDDTATFRSKLSRSVVPDVISALRGAGAAVSGSATEKAADGTAAGDEAEPEPRATVFSGDLDQVQEYFTERQWSDGLPVIPPTVARAEAFLRHTDRGPDEVIGVLAPEQREATVWNVAVNGVMAGCRPEYMPLLLAIVECLADPAFRVEDAGSTPGWEPLVVLSGPAARDLGFNWGTGVMRVGRQANTSIGRFVRLYLRNVPGLRIPPGHTDQGAIATTFNVVLAENEDAIGELGWTPFRVDQGYSRDESVVSVQSVVNISAPIYSGGDHASDHLETIATLFGNAMGPWSYLGVRNSAWYPLLVLGPSIARALAERGVGKDELRRYLYENVRIPAGEMDRYAQQVGATGFSLAQLVKEGKADPVYAQSEDPARLVPMFVRPEWIGIVVAGNPNRNQSRAYVGNHVQGTLVSRAVRFPRR